MKPAIHFIYFVIFSALLNAPFINLSFTPYLIIAFIWGIVLGIALTYHHYQCGCESLYFIHPRIKLVLYHCNGYTTFFFFFLFRITVNIGNNGNEN